MTDKIRLRELTKTDTAISWKWRNQDAVRNHFAGHPYTVSREQEEEWFEKSVLGNASMSAMAIEVVTTGLFVGIVFLKDIHKINRKAEFAIMIDQSSAGLGYGKEACYRMLKHGFTNLGLHRIFLHVRVDNPAAIHIYEACGFRKEGELRDDVFKNGAFINQYSMGILASEFNG